jgi:hypothetical protein
MRPSRLPLLLAAILTSTATFTAHAWNATGHMLVGLVAYEELDPARREEWVKILRQHPRFADDFAPRIPADVKGTPDEATWIFAFAGTWPDVARGFTGEAKAKYHHPKWHYVTNGLSLEGELVGDKPPTDPAATASKPADMNVVQALNYNLSIARDASADPASRAVALCWVLHLGGDIHQPLHCASLVSKRFPLPEGDRGGNSIYITADDGWANNPNFTPDAELLMPARGPEAAAAATPGATRRFRPELHAFWDNIMGFSEEPLVLAALRKSVTTAHPKASFATEFRKSQPAQIMEEDFRWAKAAGYSKYIRRVIALQEPGESGAAASALVPVSLGAPYAKDARLIAEARVALAGYRLADALR